jgi:hypothetical protein
MSVRPVLLKDIRRTAIEQHQLSRGTGSYNQFSPLMPRERTFSVGKRKLPADKNDDCENNTPKMARFDSSVVFEQLKGQESVLGEVKSTLDRMDSEVKLDDNVSKPVKDKLDFLGSALRLLLKSQENLTSVLVDAFKVKASPTSTVPTPASQKQVSTQQKGKGSNTAPPPEVTAAKKVKETIREAEKKILLFNLDLGKAPTMNKETLSRKVTLALSSKASGGNHDYDIKDAEEVIDDVLSCSKLEFLGTSSRKFFNKKNPKDARNDTMCTLPVRFEFKDKDTRIQAEKSLRKICKVSCAVPYPKRLRLMLDKLIVEGKKLYPDSFIRTRVNVDSLTIDAHAKTSDGWQDLNLRCNIPLDICDTVTNAIQVTTTNAIQATATNATQVAALSQPPSAESMQVS